eukprot:CAMPEP_0195007376 /NCGR_PEP_ID=MMETSP0326_2-20130528/7575_1 /TAXON_ID=2866 ORGANISM="Crypthecodinium cohnii, Strain Seligo" /NCGR_SAMPLE_ID=MMETSP0326_2 /ASSEMBLY_ACC=CAM_ASM_000348 /LENGTH=89 /DNA_ID=CAMNT_0040014699 /DNA_START=105 /DNA_END=371 /DNA_ORIENTATION=+
MSVARWLGSSVASAEADRGRGLDDGAHPVETTAFAVSATQTGSHESTNGAESKGEECRLPGHAIPHLEGIRRYVRSRAGALDLSHEGTH